MIRVLWYVLCLILLLVRMVSMYRTTTEKKKVGCWALPLRVY